MSRSIGLRGAFRHPAARALSFILALSGAGIDMSRVARDTFFLEVVGPDGIPWVYMLFAVVMVVCSTLYSLAAKRFSVKSLAITSLSFACAVLTTEALLIMRGFHDEVTAYTVFVSVEMLFLFVPMTLWAVANESFSVEQGEQYLPSIATFGLLGMVAGGLVARFTAPIIGPYNLLFVAGPLYVIAALVAARTVSTRPPARHASFKELNQGAVSPWREPIVRTLVWLAFPMWVLAYMIEYTYYVTVDKVYPSADDLARFFSVYATTTSLLAVMVQVWITPWLLKKRGPAGTCFMYPAALAFGGGCTLMYSLFPEHASMAGSLSAPVLFVLFARFLDIGLYQTLYESTVHVLYYAVPQTARTHARALVSGVVFPLSIACAGFLLVYFRFHDEPIYNVAFCSVTVGFLVLIMAMDIRPDYLQSLLRYTDRNNERLRTALLDEISHLSVNESRHVLLQSLPSANDEEAAFAIRLLVKHYDHGLLEDLVDIKANLRDFIREELMRELPADAARSFANEECAW